MKLIKKLLTIKIVCILIGVVGFFAIAIALIAAIFGVNIGYDSVNNLAGDYRGSSSVVNNQIYAQRYRSLLDELMVDNGYVSLERLIFYLQRTNNVLDVTTLSDETWKEAYLANLNVQSRQMKPIKTVCKEIKENEGLLEYTIESGTNENGVEIEALNLCYVLDKDVATSDDYTEDYSYLPFSFPFDLEQNFTTTSFVFENREVNLDLTEEEQASANFHSGWDFAVPIGTEFYSVCNGIVDEVVMTQNNDLSYNESKNSTGNYISVKCDNGLIVTYRHIKYMSMPYGIREDTRVERNDLLGLTSTTGRSTGPHLHIDAVNDKGIYMDFMEYVQFGFEKYQGNIIEGGIYGRKVS